MPSISSFQTSRSGNRCASHHKSFTILARLLRSFRATTTRYQRSSTVRCDVLTVSATVSTLIRWCLAGATSCTCSRWTRSTTHPQLRLTSTLIRRCFHRRRVLLLRRLHHRHLHQRRRSRRHLRRRRRVLRAHRHRRVRHCRRRCPRGHRARPSLRARPRSHQVLRRRRRHRPCRQSPPGSEAGARGGTRWCDSRRHRALRRSRHHRCARRLRVLPRLC